MTNTWNQSVFCNKQADKLCSQAVIHFFPCTSMEGINLRNPCGLENFRRGIRLWDLAFLIGFPTLSFPSVGQDGWGLQWGQSDLKLDYFGCQDMQKRNSQFAGDVDSTGLGIAFGEPLVYYPRSSVFGFPTTDPFEIRHHVNVFLKWQGGRTAVSLCSSSSSPPTQELLSGTSLLWLFNSSPEQLLSARCVVWPVTLFH